MRRPPDALMFRWVGDRVWFIWPLAHAVPFYQALGYVKLADEAEIRAAAQSADIQAVRESDETMWERLRKPYRSVEGEQ